MLTWSEFILYNNPHISVCTKGKQEAKYKNYFYQIDNYANKNDYILYVTNLSNQRDIMFNGFKTIEDAELFAENICEHLS